MRTGVLTRLLPLSSILSVSWPLPVMVTPPVIESRLPPVCCGATVPRLIVLEAEPVFRMTANGAAWMLKVLWPHRCRCRH